MQKEKLNLNQQRSGGSTDGLVSAILELKQAIVIPSESWCEKCTHNSIVAICITFMSFLKHSMRSLILFNSNKVRAENRFLFK